MKPTIGPIGTQVFVLNPDERWILPGKVTQQTHYSYGFRTGVTVSGVPMWFFHDKSHDKFYEMAPEFIAPRTPEGLRELKRRWIQLSIKEISSVAERQLSELSMPARIKRTVLKLFKEAI